MTPGGKLRVAFSGDEISGIGAVLMIAQVAGI
jgi:hypothetical protein